MDKYTKKIIKFIKRLNVDNNNINNNISDEIKRDFNFDLEINELINKILTICEEILHEDINIPLGEIKLLKKLHDTSEHPLLYHYLNNKNMSFVDFVKWFNINQQDINYSRLRSEHHDKELTNLIFNPIEERKELHEILYNNNFLSLDIQQYIESRDIYREVIIYVDDNINIRLTIYYEDKYKDDVDFITDIKIKAIRCIKLMDKINREFNGSSQSNYNVRLVLTPQKKILPISRLTQILTPMNINSGSALTGHFVNIWRIEELEKVLIHELQHFLGFDFHINDRYYDDVNSMIKKHFNIDDDHNRCNESYNETLAGIINMCYQSRKYSININSIYFYEMNFLLIQVVKILKYFKNDSLDVFRTTIIQTTSCVSYYILKCILFLKIIDFLEFIKNNNIRFIDDNIRKYGLFLDKILKDKTLRDELKVKLKDRSEKINKLIIDKNKFIMRTLRMSGIN